MTAKEILQSKLQKLEGADVILNMAGEVCLVAAMKEYAKQKCKKQRELCANNGIRDFDDSKSINWIIDDTIDKIFSAPEPEFE